MKKFLLYFVLLTGTATFAANAMATTSVFTAVQKTYKKIDVSQVSKDAMANIKKSYGDYKITEAAVADDGEYKLTLAKDNVSITATFTADGEMIEIVK